MCAKIRLAKGSVILGNAKAAECQDDTLIIGTQGGIYLGNGTNTPTLIADIAKGEYMPVKGGAFTGPIYADEILPNTNINTIGSASKPFEAVYSNTLYEKGVKLSDKYALSQHSHDEYQSTAESIGYTTHTFSNRISNNFSPIFNSSSTIKKITGNSLVWNQQADVIPNYSVTLTNWGMSISTDNRGCVTIQGTPTKSGGRLNFFTSDTNLVQIKAGHHYIMIVSNSNDYDTAKFAVNVSSVEDDTINIPFTKTGIRIADSSFNGRLGFNFIESQEINYSSYIAIVDLTQMFGSGKEPSDINDFYARMPQNVNLYEYNEGEIINGHYEGIKTIGYNQWDEKWESGGISSTGNLFDPTADSPYIRSVNYNRLISNTSYKITSPNIAWLIFYDNNYNFIGRTSSSNSTISTPSNARYFKLSVPNVAIYSNDICVSIVPPSPEVSQDTYAPYESYNYDLTWIKSYFPNGMKQAGSVKDEIC